jgi:eukaryotic-like serine/threonine-protein kinase
VLDDHRYLIDSARRQIEEARAACTRLDRTALSSAHLRRRAAAIPGYRLNRMVHQGGQGVVYQGEQISTGRTVAVKIMRERSFPSAIDRVRFEREVQILTELDHPNIVRIIDSGEAAGEDYLTMDFVDGLPLDRFAGSPPAGESADESRPARSLEATLRVFAEVCEAVHAAHLRGVIHRDLKPSNILVDSAGRPRVLDFGLAKRMSIDETREPAVTETGQFLGSLPWASPEQVSGSSGGIDLRSDVYSLGVVLYQLLTGAFPYPVSGPVSDVIGNILHADPTPPRLLDRRLNDEIETIVLKALSKEPQRRYQSAGDFAQDIRRYLAGELIEAKRDSLAYVIRKQLIRYRLPAAVAAAFILVIVTAGVAAASLWRSALRERDLKEAQRERAESINGVLHRMLASANPEVSRGEEVTVAEVLDGAVSELDAGSLAEQPEVEAAVRLTLGEAYLALGRLELARLQLEGALAMNERVHGRRHPETARALAALGRLDLVEGHDHESVAHLEEALAVLESAPGRAGQRIADALLLLGQGLWRLERRDEVDALHQRAYAIVVAEYGADHPETTRVRLKIDTHRLGGEHAVELLEEQLRLNRQTRGPKHPETLRTLTHLAGELHLKGRVEEAERAYLEALALGREIHGEAHQDLLRIVTNLNWLYEHIGQSRKAAALLREWVNVARATFGARSVGYADYLVLWGDTVARLESAAEGEAILRDALEILTSIGEDQNWHGAECRVRLARVLRARAAYDEVEGLTREVLAINVHEPDRMGLRRGRAQVLLGEVLRRRGDYSQAEQMLVEAYETLLPRRSMPAESKQALVQLVDLYEAWDAAGGGKASELERWRAELAEESDPSTQP